MGTHPIFESDFDCLTDLSVEKNGLKNVRNTEKSCQTGVIDVTKCPMSI